MRISINRSRKLFVGAVLAVGVLAWSDTGTAALVNHYTFDTSGTLGDDTAGSRDMTEATGGTLAQETSVTDTNGLTKTNVLRSSDVPAGSYLFNAAGSTQNNYTISLWTRQDDLSQDGGDNASVFSTGTTAHWQLEVGSSGPDRLKINNQGGQIGGGAGDGLPMWRCGVNAVGRQAHVSAIRFKVGDERVALGFAEDDRGPR